MTQARRTVTETQDKINAAANAMKTALAGIGIGAGLAEIIKMADEYAKFTAQLRLASTSAADYAASYDAVKRIARTSQQDLASTGVLYARIANGTRELGTTQKQVADITETVNLALRVSGATATESASAQLQLSQAFASGTLRGEEFNAVNEAAPRLMKALADGMGLPVGALKAMAGEGQITSNIMATVLPKALESLREESKNIQTIAGAFTVLKNEMLEFFGIQAQANGTVALITGAIRLLSENLGGLVIILKTLTAYQIGTWLATWVTKTYQQVSASIALRAATVAQAEAEMARTTSLVAQSQAAIAGLAVTHEATLVRLRSANADMVAAQAAIAAASAAGALSFALRTLRLATAELAVAETLRAAYLTESAALDRAKVAAIGQLTAATAAQVAAQAALNGVTAAGITAAGVASKAIGLLGGPIGAIILLLGTAALAWEVFGKKAKVASDQAAESFEESHARIIKALDAQIDKQENLLQLKNLGLTNQQAEKELPIIKQLEAATKRMGDLNARTGEFAGISNDDVIFKRIELNKQINELLEKQAKATKGAADVAKVTGNEAYNEWKKTYATREEQRAAEIADLKSRNLNAEQYADILGRINLKYADKDAAKALKQEENAYKTLIASIQEKLEANKLEALGFESMTDAQKMTVKLNAAILADKTKLNKADIERARVLIAQVAAEDAQLLSGKNVKKAVQELKDERDKDAASAFDEIEANKQAIATFGLTKAQIEALTLARMEERLARRGPQDLDLDEAEVNHLIRMIGLQKEKAATATTLGALDAGTDVTKAKELLDILTAVDNAAKDAASGMAASFGSVGSAIGGMTTALSGFSRDQAAIAAQLATSMKDAAGDPTKIARAQAMAAQQGAQAQVRSYGDMASAAKGFFKENSTGYKVMQTAEKAFRAYEMAMAVESMVKKIFFKETEVAANLTLNATKLTGEVTTSAASTGLAATEASAWGITAVVKALASLPFPANLAAGAATLAAVVAIGAKLMGGMGGGSVSLSEQRQAATGTGTVLGDSSAKSESIAHSLAIMEKNSGLGLAYSASMASSLRQVVAGIGGLGGLLVRNAGVTGSVAPDSYGAAQNLFNSTLGKIPLIGGILGKVGGGVLGSIFGGKTTTLDTGLTLSKATLDSIAGRGVSSSQYTDTKTSGGWFSSDKNSTALNGLGPEANDQFTKIILGLRDTVQSSATALGIGGDAFNARLKTFVVDLGKISLKDLKGEEIQKALEAAFSKLGDDMASFGVAGLEQYQAVGEGYLETLARVANDYMQVSDVLAVLGKSFNTTGLGAVALSESLIAAAGGLESLTSGTGYFVENFLTEAERMAPITKSVNDAMGRLGQSGVTTVE
ncbi:tape measure domain-containing protein, partial [Janthinobacterium sp. TND4EL3]